MIEIELSATFVSQYKKNKTSLEYLITSAVPKKILLRLYEYFLIEENLTPIEKLPEEAKKELVNECRATGLFFTNESLIKSAKILHTLKFIG